MKIKEGSKQRKNVVTDAPGPGCLTQPEPASNEDDNDDDNDFCIKFL